MFKIKNIEIFVISERSNFSKSVSEKKFQNKDVIIDNIKKEPIKIDIRIIINDNYLNKYNEIKNISESEELVTYDNGKIKYTNMVVNNCVITNDKNIENGFFCDISMAQAQVYEEKNIIIVGKDPITDKQVREKESEINGRQLKVEEYQESDTYLVGLINEI